MSNVTAAEDVLKFWFKDLTPSDWFKSHEELDLGIKRKFSDIHARAMRGELSHWRVTPEGRLAEIIVLDQFSRNIYRGTPSAFAQDTVALVLAQEMVLLKQDQFIEVAPRAFIYMPYMHSESKVIHMDAMKLFSAPGLEENYKFEQLHKEIIDRFGRYPHRNTILGRTSTTEEIEYLKIHPGF